MAKCKSIFLNFVVTAISYLLSLGHGSFPCVEPGSRPISICCATSLMLNIFPPAMSFAYWSDQEYFSVRPFILIHPEYQAPETFYPQGFRHLLPTGTSRTQGLRHLLQVMAPHTPKEARQLLLVLAPHPHRGHYRDLL
jgi:hypothetical protein